MYFSHKKEPITSTPTSSPSVTSGSLTIVNSIPADNASSFDVFSPITLTFDRSVSSLSISVTSDPAEDWTTSQVTPKSVAVNHKLYLRDATSYQLTILQYGKAIGTLTFKTAHNQNDPRQLQTLQSNLNNDYPLAASTPYETPDYVVVYSAPLTLDIQLSGTLTAQDAILQVQTWVKSKGIDPATHKYIVTTPSPTP
jgi:Bacterial Ig-like domain